MSVVLFLFGKNRLLYRYPYHNPFEIEQIKTKQGEANHKQVASTTVNTHSNVNALPLKGDKPEFSKCINTTHSISNSSTASEGLSVSSKTTTSTSTTSSSSSNNNNNNNNIMRRQGVRMPTSASQESLYHRYSSNNNNNNEEFTLIEPSTEISGALNEKSKTLQHSYSALNLSNSSFGTNRFNYNNNNNSNDNMNSNNDTSLEAASYKQSNKLLEEEGVLESEEDDHYGISHTYKKNNNNNNDKCYGGKGTPNEEGQLYCEVSSSQNALSSQSHLFSSSESSETPSEAFRTPPKIIIVNNENNNNNNKNKNKTQNKKDSHGISAKDNNIENTFCIYTENQSNKNLCNRAKRKISKARSCNNKEDVITIKHNIFTRLYEDEEMDKAALRELLEIIQNNIQLQENNSNNNESDERKHWIQQWLKSFAPYEIEEVMTGHSVNDLHSMLRYVGHIRLERPTEISCIGLSHIALEQLIRATPSSCATLHFAHVTLLLYRIVLSDEACLEQEEYPFMESEEEFFEEEEEEPYFDDIHVWREEEQRESIERINKQRKERLSNKRNVKKPSQDASSVMLVIALNRGDDAQNSLASFVQCIVNVWCREELREQYVSREINTIEHTTKILEFYDDKSNVEVGSEFISSTSSINTYGTNRTQNINVKTNVEKAKSRAENLPFKAFTEANVEQEEKRMSSSEHVRNATLIDQMSSNIINNKNYTDVTNDTSTIVRTVNMFNFLFLYLRHSVTLLRTCKELVKVLNLWMRVLRQVEPSELNKFTRQTFPLGHLLNESREHNEYGVHCNNNNKIMDVIVYHALSELPDGLWINRHLYLPLRYLLGYTPSEYTSESSYYKNSKKTLSLSSSSPSYYLNNSKLNNVIKQPHYIYNYNYKNKVEFKWPHPCISVQVCSDILQECERNKVISEEEESNKHFTGKQIEENKGQEEENNLNEQDNCIELNKAANKITHSLIASLYEQSVGEWFAKYLPWNTIANFLLNSQCSFTFGTLYRYLESVLLTNIRDNLYKSKIAKLNKYINADTNKKDKLSSHSAHKKRQYSTSGSLCSPCTNAASTCVLLKVKESQRSSLPNSQLTSPCTNLEQQPQQQQSQQPSSSSLTSSPTLSCSGMQKLKREESYSHNTRYSSKGNIKRKAIQTKKQEIIKEANFVAFQQVIKYSPALTKIGSFLESHAFIRNESESKLHVSLSHCELAPLESTVAMYFDSNNIYDGKSANEPSLVIPPLLFIELLQTNTNKYNESDDSHDTSAALSQNEPLTKSNESANTFTWPGSAEHQLTLPQRKNKNNEFVASTRTSPYLTSAMLPVSSKSVNINNGKTFSLSKFSRDKHASGSASSNRQVIGISSPLLLSEQQQIEQRRKEVTFPINNNEDVEIETPFFTSPWLDASSPITPLSAMMDTRHSSWASYKLPWKLESEWLHKRSEAMSAQTNALDKHKEQMTLSQAHEMSVESGINVYNHNSKKSSCLSKTPEANRWTVESSSVASSQHSWTVTHSWKGTENAAQQSSLHSFDERRANREGKHTYLHEEREEEEEEEELIEEEVEKTINGIDAHDESQTHENANVQVRVEKTREADDDNYIEGKTREADYTKEKYGNGHHNNNNVKSLPKLRVHCVWGEACPFCEALAASASVQLTPPLLRTELYNYPSEFHVQEAINSKIYASKATDCNNASEDSYNDNAGEAAMSIENSLEKNVQYKWQFPCNRSDRLNRIYIELEFPQLHFNVLNWTRQCALYEYTMMQITEKSKQAKLKENVNSGNDNANKNTKSSYHNNNNNNNKNNSLNLHSQSTQPFAIFPSSVTYSEELQQQQQEQEVYLYEQGEHHYHSCDFSVASCTHKERPWFVRPEIYFSTHTSHMYSPLEMYHDLLTTSQEHKPHYKNMKNKLQNESVHGSHSRLSRRHEQGNHSYNKYLPWEEEEEYEEQEEEGLEEDVEEVREVLSSKQFTEPVNSINQNNNQVRSQNSQIMRQMRINWSSSKNGKTGSIDDTELTLWMNTHPDVTTGNDINHFNDSSNKSEKVFIDGIIICHEASAWLQRNSHELRQRLVYEMELAQAIHSTLVIYQTQEERNGYVNSAKVIGTDMDNDDNNNNKLEVQPIRVSATQTQPISVCSHKTCKSDNIEITNIKKQVKLNTSIRQVGVESRQPLPSLRTESSEESEEELELKEHERPSSVKTSASLPSSLISSLSKSRYLRYNKRQLPQRNVTQCMSPLSLEPNSWHAAQEKKANSNNPAMHQSLLSHSYNSRNNYQNNSEERSWNNNNKNNTSEMIRRSSTNYLTDTNVSLNVNGSYQNTCYTFLTDTSSNKINIYNNINNNINNYNHNNNNMTENEREAHDKKSSQITQLSIPQEINEQFNKVQLNSNSLAKGATSNVNNYINNNNECYYSQNKSTLKEQLGKSIGALSTSQELAHLHLRFLPNDILLQCAIHMTVILLWSHAQVEIAMLQRQLERLLHHLSTLLSNLQYVNQLIVAGYSSRLAWKLMCQQESDHHGHVKSTRKKSSKKWDKIDQTTTMEQVTKIDSIILENNNNLNTIEQENDKTCKEHLAYSSLPPTPSPTSANTFAKNNNNVAMAFIPVMSDAFVPSAHDVHLLQLYELFNEMCVTELIAPYNGCKLPQIPTPLLLHAIINEISDVLSINQR